jgi:hypothetical protein
MPERRLGGTAVTWRPLSVREGQSPDEGPYEGVPPHLYEPLRQWTDNFFGGRYNSYSDANNGPRLISAARLPIAPSPNGHLTVRNVTTAISDQPYRMLDIVDAVLHYEDFSESYAGEASVVLEEILRLGGSVWEIDS